MLKERSNRKRSIITADHSATRTASFFEKLPSNLSVNSVPSDEVEHSSPIIDEATEPTELIETVDSVTSSEVSQLNTWHQIKVTYTSQIGSV